jgi:putative transposase
MRASGRGALGRLPGGEAGQRQRRGAVPPDRRAVHRLALSRLAPHDGEEIFNTDQGSQFTSAAFTGALAEAGVAISMDGRGRWRDNVFIERLWRSLKYEDVYLKGYADGRVAARAIAEWVAFYNEQHQALADRAPMAVWREAIAGSRAVDMTLRLDNAIASPTCPQPRNSRRSLSLHDRKEPRAVGPPI